jgi:hypothetical protein
MEFLLIAFGAYWVTRVIRLPIEAPEWVWDLFTLIPSIAGLALTGSINYWYSAPALAGMAVLLQRVEDLLMTRADEARVAAMRRRP